jgi:hypothetical protein
VAAFGSSGAPARRSYEAAFFGTGVARAALKAPYRTVLRPTLAL